MTSIKLINIGILCNGMATKRMNEKGTKTIGVFEVESVHVGACIGAWIMGAMA